jgi:DNA-binding transcriptional LysR family regulator
VPHWRAAPDLIAHTDLVLTVATRTLTQWTDDPQLAIVSPPLPIPSFPFVQIWHDRFNADAGHKWLRELIAQIGSTSGGHSMP